MIEVLVLRIMLIILSCAFPQTTDLNTVNMKWQRNVAIVQHQFHLNHQKLAFVEVQRVIVALVRATDYQGVQFLCRFALLLLLYGFASVVKDGLPILHRRFFLRCPNILLILICHPSLLL